MSVVIGAFCSMLTIALMVLKMLDRIDCSWFVVILPVLVSLIFVKD